MDTGLHTDRAVTHAKEHFIAGYHCSESALMGLLKSPGVESDLVPRIASGFGGGVGGTHRQMCGALSGAVMAAGIAFGRDRLGNTEERMKNPIQRLIEEFRHEFGAVNCYQLVGIPYQHPQYSNKWHALNIREKRCVLFVRFATARRLELAETTP